MQTCNDCIHSEVCVRQKIYGEYSITECKGHFLGKEDVQEVKHGEWEKRDFIIMDNVINGYRCSICNTTWDTNTNYCPHCGAIMDKRSDTE